MLQITERHMGIVHWIMKGYIKRGLTPDLTDELYSRLFYEMALAALRYKPELDRRHGKEGEGETYLTASIKLAVKSRVTILIKNHVSHDSIDDHPEPVSHPDRVPDQINAKQVVEEIKRQLSSRAWSIIYARHFDHKSLPAIAAEMGISKRAVHKIEQDAMNRIRERFSHVVNA